MRVEFRQVTEPDRCPYLDGRQWQLDVRHVSAVAPDEHDREMAAGSRRFGETYFRPACSDCRECVPLRVLAGEFRASKSQRRVWRRNADLHVEIGEPLVDDERLELYHRFHVDRHERLGWPRPVTQAIEYYVTFVASTVRTHEFRYRLGGRLVGIGYVDEGPESLSSVYGFHDPAESRRGLGTFDILTEIDIARRRGKRYLYLGYFVRGCRSMEYKAAFRPYELMLDGRWVPGDASGESS